MHCATPFIVSALYQASSTFNLSHYESVHMPLAMSRFASFGLQSYQIVKLNANQSQGYGIHTIMIWDDETGMREGFAAHGDEMDADLPNFSDTEPVGLLGNVVSRSG
jgi:uncharacterized protein (TIGR02118 family)